MENNYRKALEIATEANNIFKNDWWWRNKLGTCFYKLGMLRDSEAMYNDSIKLEKMIVTYLESAKIPLRLDQPLKAIEIYHNALIYFQSDISLNTASARVYEMLSDFENSTVLYQLVLSSEAYNLEALASIASENFYNDQPEISLKYYKRLIEMGVYNAEIWNNIGLSAFYSSQYDLCFTCMLNALALSDKSNVADVWYNLGHIACGLGDTGMAYQAFKLAISLDRTHAESYNNLGVLEMQKDNVEQARKNFQLAIKLSSYIFQPLYNFAILAYKVGDYQECFNKLKFSLGIFPDFPSAKTLLENLSSIFINK